VSSTEDLFDAVAAGDWSRALGLVHAVRLDSGAVAVRARAVLVDTMFEDLTNPSAGPEDDDLEKALLLHRAGFLNLDPDQLDLLAETLVIRNSARPAKAVQYARYRPEADACRGVLAQFEAAGPSAHSGAASGTITEVEASNRIDGRRPLFRSKQEVTLYHAAQRVFSGQILVPNAALHTAIDFDAIKGVLTREERDVFFRVLVDLIVFDPEQGSRASHFIELDSPWHDDPEAKGRDRVKERMAGLAGCRVIRLRPSGSIDLAGMMGLLQSAIATGQGGSAS
jgi:hypothetical protein